MSHVKLPQLCVMWRGRVRNDLSCPKQYNGMACICQAALCSEQEKSLSLCEVTAHSNSSFL